MVLECVLLSFLNLRLSADSGSVGSDGRTGSGGEEEGSGVPGNHTKDALPAPHPHPLLPGTSLSCLQEQLSIICIWHTQLFYSAFTFFTSSFYLFVLPRLPLLLSEHRPAVPGVADDKSG